VRVFDHHTEEFARDWREIYTDLRRDCPVAHSDRHGGFYVLTRYADVKAALHDPRTFSCARAFDQLPGVKGGVTVPRNPFRLGMMEMDPPEATGYRRVLAPLFSAKAVREYLPRMTEIVAWSVDRVIESGRIDFVDDLANPVPALITLDYLGLPLENWADYARVLHRAVYREAGSARDLELLLADLTAAIKARRAAGPGGGDFVDTLLNADINGEPLSDEMVVEMVFTVLNGGIDTSTALIAHMFLHLEEHPDDRAALIADPSRIPGAVDEMVRHVTPGPGLARTVLKPVEIAGTRLEPGDRVLLAFGSANTDDEMFPDANRVDIGRENAAKHLSFGSGIHRCLGASLAPAEMTVLLEQVLARMPDYRIDVDAVRAYPKIPLVNGFIAVPATFTPGEPQLSGFASELPVSRSS
jgi:cytochrome P450